MKRFKIVGLCLLAVFALGAVMASAAQAGEFGKCEKANPKNTGLYSEKTCETLATPAKTGKYEWVPNKAVIATVSFGGESVLIGTAGQIKCKRGIDKGAITGAKTNTEVFTFLECELLPFKFVCKNGETEVEGKKVPSITTYALKTKLLDHGEKGPSGKEPKEKEVWNVVEAEGVANESFLGPGPWLAAFECGPGIPFAVSGSVSGVIDPADVSNPKLKKGKGEVLNPKFKKGKGTYIEHYTKEGGEQDLTTTFFNPETKAVESGASVQEGENNIAIEALPKGLEILDL